MGVTSSTVRKLRREFQPRYNFVRKSAERQKTIGHKNQLFTKKEEKKMENKLKRGKEKKNTVITFFLSCKQILQNQEYTGKMSLCLSVLNKYQKYYNKEVS